MPSVQERLRTLVEENLEIEGRAKGQPLVLTNTFADAGVNSMAAVAFLRVVMSEFNVEIPAEELAQLSNLQGLVDYLEAHAG